MNSIELTTKAAVKIAVNTVSGGAGGGGVSSHHDLTGLTTGDDHTQYQRSESTFTSASSFTITDQSTVVSTGSTVVLPDAQTQAGRYVLIGAGADLTVQCAGTDVFLDGTGSTTFAIQTGNAVGFTSVDVGGQWGWAVTTRQGSSYDLPKWVGQSLAAGKVLRIDGTGAPAWANVDAADVPSLAASKITSGTFDVARLPVGTTSTTVAAGNDSRITGAVQGTRTVNGKALSADVTLTAADVSAVPTTRTVNSKALSADVTLAASDVGAVPTTRTVNSKALSSDVTLTASDVGALSSSDASVTNARVPQWRRLTFSNANYDLSATPSPAVSGSVFLQQTGTVNAARTVTLPAASACPAGSEVIVNGGAGVTGTNTVTIQRAGTDTINGATTSVVIGTAWGQRRFVSDGTSAWAYDDGLVRRSQNLGDLADAPTARTNLGLGSLATLSTITSSEITDGTIVNADISASAAIATSKISGLATIATSGSASDLSAGTVPSARLSTKAVGGQGAGSQVNEPSVATSLLTSTVTLPACAAGDVLIIDAGINFTQNSAASRNVTFAVKIGATTMLSTTPSVTASATARQAHLHAVIRVLSTTSQSGEMLLSYTTASAGSTGVASAATGTATETISSGSLALDVLVTATSNTTQNYTLTSLSVNKVAA